MQRDNAQPTFTDASVADLGGPRTAAFLQRCEQLIDWRADWPTRSRPCSPRILRAGVRSGRR